MNIQEFQKALLYGFGSAVIFAMNNEISEEYEEIIYKFSIHNYVFDAQCENDRAVYLWDLIKNCKNSLKLQTRIMKTLELNDEAIDHYQIYRLGLVFARNSSYNPIELMKNNFRFFDEVQSFIGEEEILELADEEGAIFVSQLISDRLNTFEEYDGEFFWIERIIDRFGKRHVEEILFNLIGENERFCKYYQESLKWIQRDFKREADSYEKIKSDIKSSRFNRIAFWAKFASDKEISQVVYDINNSKDLDLVSKLMRTFLRVEFKEPIDGFIEYLDTEEYNLSTSVVNILKWKEDSRIRSKAFEMMEKYNEWYDYIPLLYKNFESNDYHRILKYLDRDYDEYEWHGIQLSLKKLFNVHPNTDCYELYTSLYKNGRCTICREEQLEYMLRDGYDNLSILEECNYDVNLEIRELVRSLNKNTNHFG